MLLYHTDQGEGEPVVLLHGMAGSGRYWDTFIPYLGNKNRIINIDLLGYGRSPMPGDDPYTYESHLRSIIETLDHLKMTRPVILVGHSMGALLALRLATLYPERVTKLVLIGMPIYSDAEHARNAITKSRLRNKLTFYGPTSHVLCITWCRILRPVSKRIAPYYLKYLPKTAAEDSVLHTWQSYSRSLANIVENQQVGQDITRISVPTILIYGSNDLPEGFKEFSATKAFQNIDTHVLPGGHQIVYEHPREIVGYIMA